MLSQNLGGIYKQIIKLNSVLDEISNELDVLKSEIEGFDSTLSTAREKIEKSTGTI